MAARLHRTPRTPAQRHRTETTLKGFLTNVWLRRKRPNLRSTTAYRYSWMIERYIAPRLGEVPLRQLRDDHLDDLYNHLIGHGGKGGAPLSPKTVHEVHLIVRNALDLAVTRHLVDTNVARAVHSPRRRGGGPVVARVWDARELAEFLVFAGHHRLYPLLHLAAHTGMRRGELAGLQWRDLDSDRSRLSVTRTIQSVAGRPTIFGVKTRTSRRTVDLDTARSGSSSPGERGSRPTGCRPVRTTGCSVSQPGRPSPQPRIGEPAVRADRAPVGTAHHPVPRHPPHARLAARCLRRADQGGHRTTRPRAPGVHDAHLPAPPTGHERASRRRLRRSRRRGRPVDVYRLRRHELAGH